MLLKRMVLAVEFETKVRCEKMAMAKEEELFALKRPALQKMAKLHGIKANKKNADIIKDLIECFTVHQPQEEVLSVNNREPQTEKNCVRDDKDLKEKNEDGCNQNIHESENIVPSIKKANNSRIPKLAGGILKDKRPINFKQIHEKSFNKMESIDDYIDKKRQRANQLKFSLKAVAKGAVEVLTSMKQSHHTPKVTSKTVAKSAAEVVTSNKQRNHTRKVIPKGKTSIGTPRHVFDLSNVKSKVDSWRTERTSSRKTMFDFRSPVPKFDMSEKNSDVKKFDLKESLKKPLTYKPHRGKLRGLDQTYVNKENKLEQRQTSIKIMNRSERDRKEARKTNLKNNRNAAKEKLLEKRRGLKI